MIICVIQARMGSTRLPGKIMLPLMGKTVLWHVWKRVTFASKIDRIVVATSTNEEDNCIEIYCKENGIDVFRGDPVDVLQRYYDALQMFLKNGTCIDYMVRITSDCPLIDPRVIDHVIEVATEKGCDYASNVDPPTFPDGLDTEVFTPDILVKAYHGATLPSEREHVTLWIRKREDIHKCNITNVIDLSFLRWTLDYTKDYEFIKEVYQRLYKVNEIFDINKICSLLKKEPALSEINKKYQRNEGLIKSIEDESNIRGM
jgi:spore coat polysaccharide biosynthesis protein SpsF